MKVESVSEVTVQHRGIHDWSSELLEKFHATARMVYCGPAIDPPRHLVRVIEMAFDPSQDVGVVNALKKVSQRRIIASKATGPGVRVVVCTEPVTEMCRMVAESGATCRECPFLTEHGLDGSVPWTLRVPTSYLCRLKPLIERVSSKGIGTVTRIGRLKPRSRITDAQSRAITTAFRLGYFDSPRSFGLASVAATLSVSRTAALGLIRRGVHRIVQDSGMAGEASAPSFERWTVRSDPVAPPTSESYRSTSSLYHKA